MRALRDRKECATRTIRLAALKTGPLYPGDGSLARQAPELKRASPRSTGCCWQKEALQTEPAIAAPTIQAKRGWWAQGGGQKRCGRLLGESRPRANPVWGRGGVGT